METNHFYLAVFLALCNAAAIFGNLAPPVGPRKLKYDAADSFKVFQSFQNVVAIEDSDNDTMFNCWTADRAAIDSDARTATYTAHFPKIRKDIPFYLKAEQDSPRFTYTLEDDKTIKEGVYYYTDYENCLVKDLEYHGHQCVLWVKKELKNAVPQICLDYYADICGAGVFEYNEDFCKDN
ncbi:hypothetical protein HPB50_023525 [Hyalomma asiaticum]|uniref:Uncharacterized protein n=1 Tax=Hyalomma asiaticum TaxID=266040 RepID=A0ACB7SC27_HYAAI|nr:hypothetical protein HPB50_023525 [Hyalomma asiaticum]